MTCPDYHDWLSSAQDDEPFTLHMRDACTRALELAMSMCFVANFGPDHGGRTYEALSVMPQKCSGHLDGFLAEKAADSLQVLPSPHQK